jgi:HAE1 family hydrophobic/amphiphilic exporter-1
MRPIVTVTTTYENTGQLEIEELISRPIESALSSLHGIDQITSTSTEGRSDIRVTFQWGADKEDAVNDISGHIDSVLGALPKGVNRPLLIAEVERSDPPAQSFETVLIKIISSIPIIGERIYRYN